jgi:hypothetical protein
MAALPLAGLLLYCLLNVSASTTAASRTRQQQMQHAPLPEQCRADFALWYNINLDIEYTNAEAAHISDGTPNRTETNKLHLTEVNERTRELLDCRKVDSSRQDDYLEAVKFYQEIVANREYNFIIRHDLWNQLMREDAEGKR